MRTLEDVERAFAVGWQDDVTAVAAGRIQNEFEELARTLWQHLPNGPEKTLALRSLWRTQSEAQLALCLAATPDPE
jgi:hypothetical protein